MPKEKRYLFLTRRDFARLGIFLSFACISRPFNSAFAKTLVALDKKSHPLPEKKPKAPRLLMLDPGHGGKDPGAIGAKGLMEKDITLDIAKQIAESLAKDPDVTVKLTREKDDFISLSDRVAKARSARADLFVSIHADSAPNIHARGLSVYTLSRKASDDFAKAIAERENLADLTCGVDITNSDQEVALILYDLASRRTANLSQSIKAKFVRAVGKNLLLLDRPMRSANFAVLRAPDIPSILVEVGFLSNAKDEALLSKQMQRQKIAFVMAKELKVLIKSPILDS